MTFFLKTEIPDSFPRTEKIEVASADTSFDVLLSVSDGNLILQNSQTVMAVLDPLKSFGASAFGPLQFRPGRGRERQGRLAGACNFSAASLAQGSALP